MLVTIRWELIMDQVSLVKKQFRTEQWKKRIAECQTSGMSVKSWCKQNGLCEQTYYKYLKQFRQELCDMLPAPVQETAKPIQFSKLEVHSPLPDTKAAVIIRLPNATLEINEGASQQTVQAVLLANTKSSNCSFRCVVIYWNIAILKEYSKIMFLLDCHK